MKVIGYTTPSEKHVEILFDELDITYPDMFQLSRDPRFIAIARKNGLTSMELEAPNHVQSRNADLWLKENGKYKEVIFVIGYRLKGGLVLMHKEYPQVAEDVFGLVTKYSLGNLWKAYLKEKGVTPIQPQTST